MQQTTQGIISADRFPSPLNRWNTPFLVRHSFCSVLMTSRDGRPPARHDCCMIPKPGRVWEGLGRYSNGYTQHRQNAYQRGGKSCAIGHGDELMLSARLLTRHRATICGREEPRTCNGGARGARFIFCRIAGWWMCERPWESAGRPERRAYEPQHLPRRAFRSKCASLRITCVSTTAAITGGFRFGLCFIVLAASEAMRLALVGRSPSTPDKKR